MVCGRAGSDGPSPLLWVPSVPCLQYLGNTMAGARPSWQPQCRGWYCARRMEWWVLLNWLMLFSSNNFVVNLELLIFVCLLFSPSFFSYFFYPQNISPWAWQWGQYESLLSWGSRWWSQPPWQHNNHQAAGQIISDILTLAVSSIIGVNRREYTSIFLRVG